MSLPGLFPATAPLPAEFGLEETAPAIRPRFRFSRFMAFVVLCVGPMQPPLTLWAAEPPPEPRENLPLRAFLARERSIERDMARAEKEIQANRSVDAIRTLQSLLDRGEDCFLWSPEKGVPESARHQAERLITSLGPEGLQTYRDFSDAAAADLLREADQSNDPAGYAEILRRLFLTTPALDAVDRLASRAMSRGEAAVAVRLWRRVIEEKAHARRLGTAHWQKIHAAAVMADDQDLIERAFLALNAAKATPRFPLRPEHRRTPREPLSIEWLQPYGDAGHTAGSGVTVPWLAPVWTADDRVHFESPSATKVAPLVSPASKAGTQAPANDPANAPIPDVTERARTWSEEKLSALQSPAGAPQAIVAGDQVVFRDAEGLRAVSLTSGASVWTYRTAASLRYPVAPDVKGATNNASIPDFGPAHAENSVLGLLTSDGDRVFAIEAVDLRTARPAQRATDPSNTGTSRSRSWNRLIALSITGDAAETTRRPVWSLGGAPGGARDALQGAYFFGPPLPHDGRLFAIIEIDRQISAVCLRAHNGELLWSQALGYVDRAVDYDDFRAQQACIPTLVDGVLVCPTNAGFLLALDCDTGSLLWAVSSGNERADNRFSMSNVLRLVGSRSFPNVLIGARGRVLAMPHHSSQIVCHDIATGAPRWTAPRLDAEYLATVNESLLVVVGRRQTRGLSLVDGKTVWATNTGMPCGIGVRAGLRYLIPLRNGTVNALDIATGQIIGMAFPLQHAASERIADAEEEEDDDRDEPLPVRLGNLIPSGEFILSCEPLRITAYRVAGTLLDESAADLMKHPENLALRFLVARLRLTNGDFDPARLDLRTVVQSANDAGLRERAEGVLRDVLFRDLGTAGTNVSEVLAELDRLCREPSVRAHYLMTRAEIQARVKNFSGALEAAHEFAALREADEPQPLSNNAMHFVSPGRWIPRFLSRLQTETGETDHQRLQTQVLADRETALSRGDIGSLEAFLSVYAHRPEADTVRLRLARLLSDNGRIHQAELAYLECRNSTDRATQAAAVAGLAELWERLGMFHQSARLLVELEETYTAELKTADGPTRAWLDAQNAESPVRSLRREFAAPAWPVSRVRIEEDRLAIIDSRLEESFGPYRRKLATPPDSGFFLLDRGVQSNAEGNRLSIIDRYSGAATGDLVVPRSMQLGTPLQRLALVGHFFPYGVDGQACGASLTEASEGGPTWSTTLKHLPIPGDVRPGPVGPNFASFVARQYLAALEPRTGRILWERTDIDPLGSQPEVLGAVYGDESALVMLASDRSSFIVFRTDTGEEIRRMKTDDLGILRWAFGRKLLFAPDGDSERTLRLWDPVTNQTVWSLAVDERVFTLATPNDQLVVVTTNQVLLVDPKSNKTLTSATIPNLDLPNLNTLKAFTDDDTFYVNLQRDISRPAALNNNTAADTFLPVVNVTGELYAIDRATGAVRWKRTVPTRSIIDLPHHRLPFLIGLSQVRDRQNGSRQSLLVEVFDKRTGRTLGLRDNLVPSRLVLLGCDPSAGRVELTGLRTMVRLHFERALQRQGDLLQ